MFKPTLAPTNLGATSLNRTRYARPARWRLDIDDWRVQTLIAAITLGTVLYNMVLAFVNAHGVGMTSASVAASEMLLLGCAGVILLLGGLDREDFAPLVLFYVFLLLCVGLSLLNSFVYVNSLRNVLIISFFTMLGRRTHETTFVRMIVVATLLVFAVLLLEILSTSTYVQLFEPGLYYQNTRGMEVQDYNNTGLFQGSLGFESRFSFGLLDHRATSLFLEQVSLANYSAVLSIVLISLWTRLSWPVRIALISVMTLIVLTNSTRTGSAILLSAPIGYFLYPHLPRFGTLLIAPIALGFGLLVIATTGFVEGDNLAGRMTVTVQAIANMDLSALAGLQLFMSERMLDSGFGYVIISSSVFGLLALWIYIAEVLPRTSAEQKRCAFGVGVYIFANMMVSGTSIFSIKTAAPLWLIVGFLLRPPVNRQELVKA